MSADISVIITTYNDAELLKRAINSVYVQSLTPKEIIVVDDGSLNDDAQKVVNEFKNNTTIKIFFYKKNNGGPSDARNFGINKSNCKFITFLDADDEMTINSIKKRYAALIKLDERYAVVYANAFLIKKTKIIKQKFKIVDGYLNENTKLIGRQKGIPGGSCYYIFKKNIFKEVGGFNIHLSHNEDFELLLRIAKKWKFYGIDTFACKIYIRSESLSRKNYYKSYEGVEQFLDLAIQNNLLSDNEISIRRKENRLSLVKKMIYNNGSWNEISSYIIEAFIFKKPNSIKEYFIFIINSILLYLKKINLLN